MGLRWVGCSGRKNNSLSPVRDGEKERKAVAGAFWLMGASKNLQFRVIPAALNRRTSGQAGIRFLRFSIACKSWIPAFAGLSTAEWLVMTQVFRSALMAHFGVCSPASTAMRSRFSGGAVGQTTWPLSAQGGL